MRIEDGSVKIDDISDSDYQYLKPILWLEVTTFFDQHKISILKKKANNKYKSEYCYSLMVFIMKYILF